MLQLIINFRYEEKCDFRFVPFSVYLVLQPVECIEGSEQNVVMLVFKISNPYMRKTEIKGQFKDRKIGYIGVSQKNVIHILNNF